jgi:hypothetical protein
MSCDKLVYDLSQEVDAQPNIFVKKDWLTILDNQNGNYASNQCVVDTSQLTNSNKWLSYREGFLNMPLLIAVTSGTAANLFLPVTQPGDYFVGLKNWFGSVVHSMSMDLNGVTVIQQTPFCNMWNSFKLMTSLSWNDVSTIGSSIGFYPDDPLSWSFQGVAASSGLGVCNNTNYSAASLDGFLPIGATNNVYKATNGNIGFLKRQSYINYDSAGIPGSGTYAALLSESAASSVWKSYVLTASKLDSTVAVNGRLVISVNAVIYLKHLHSFFQFVPLLKGVFLKLTMNLNNTSCDLTVAGGGTTYSAVTVSNAVGGVNPLMVSSQIANNGGATVVGADGSLTASISVGNRCLTSSQSGIVSAYIGPNPNVTLNVPAYSFNPLYEQSYISNPVKTIEYSDIYQYQVPTVTAGNPFNQLLTNGIASVKSVLVLPFFTSSSSGAGVSPWQSPFDPAGCGPTSPLCLLSNFNVVVSGQNAIYNSELYNYQHFHQQLLGANAVNGGLTDGLTSGLVDSLGFDMEYNYYYVNVERMLPIEKSVPKSISVIGTNKSAKDIILICFVEYGVSLQVDVTTGARI